VMCGPNRSSEWAKDQGDSNNGIKSVSKDLINDLVSISDNIEHMTIQGGEPSIMKEYEYYFECLDKKNALCNIDLQVITNATNVNTKFYKLLERFKSVRLSVSIDAFGKANNYIRWPSSFEQIEKNLIKMSELRNNIKVEILNTLNVLSMFDYHNFLTWCKKIESLYEEKGKYFGVIPMKIINPVQWSPFIAPENLKDKFAKDIRQFIKIDNLTHNSNFKTEIIMLMNSIQKNEPKPNAIDLLKSSVEKLDTQRGIKITDYIPDFYKYL
jgi:MoaA/NifB/PqqE/SkfB family radical SAM enzyme